MGEQIHAVYSKDVFIPSTQLSLVLFILQHMRFIINNDFGPPALWAKLNSKWKIFVINADVADHESQWTVCFSFHLFQLSFYTKCFCELTLKFWKTVCTLTPTKFPTLTLSFKSLFKRWPDQTEEKDSLSLHLFLLSSLSFSLSICLVHPLFFLFSLQLSPSLDSSRQKTRNNRRQERKLHSGWCVGPRTKPSGLFFSIL